MKMETNIVYQEDCIEGMKKIPSNSIDLVLTDPPYGITACEWDKPIDLKKWWVEIKRIIKPNGAIVMTASQPFTTDLINSNREMFKYELIWDKVKPSGFQNAKYMPMRQHENILLFAKNKSCFNPQLVKRDKIRVSKQYGKSDGFFNGENDGKERIYKYKNPKSIITFSNANNKNKFNPTQKPIELFKWLIKSYSNENQLVLDCFGGSGTTAIACLETNRKYILFENNPQYFKIINNRIKSAKSQTQLSNESCPNGEFNMGLTATQQVATPKSASQTSLNPNIKRNLRYAKNV